MINAQKDKLTFSQIVIFVWGGVIVLVAVLFLQFLNGPARSRMLDIQEQLDLVESRLRWMTGVVDTVQDPSKVLYYFMETERSLGRRFPATAEKSMLLMADYANKFGLRIERIQPEEPRKVVDARGRALGADGKECYGVQLSIKFKGDYYNLAKYLDALRKVLPAFLVVRGALIENDFSSASKLAGSVDLSLYLLE